MKEILSGIKTNKKLVKISALIVLLCFVITIFKHDRLYEVIFTFTFGLFGIKYFYLESENNKEL
ncbi:MAG: hypothetical protein RR984_00840 [Bacilli bacterium]